LQALNQGGIPADTITSASGRQPTGAHDQLYTRSANPAIQGTTQDPGRIVTIGGKRLYMPTASEKEERSLNDTNSFEPTGLLDKALVSAGRKPGQRIKNSESHAILQALNEAQPKEDGWELDTSGKIQNAQGDPMGFWKNKKGQIKLLDLSGLSEAGGDQQQPAPQGNLPGGPTIQNAQQPGGGALIPRGSLQQSSPGAAPGGLFDLSQQQPAAGDSTATIPFPFDPSQRAQPQPSQPAQRGAAPAAGVHFALPAKPEKPDKYTYNHFTDDRGAVSVTRIGPDDSPPEKWDGKKWAPLEASEAIGPKRRDPDAAPRQKPPSAAQLRMVTKTKADRLEKAQGAYKKAVAGAIDDDEKTQAAADLKQEYQAAQNEYESGISTLTGNDVPHNDWADRMTAGGAAPASAAPAQPAQRTAAPGGGAGRPAPPEAVTKGLAPGTHTFGNGQIWRKNADGSMVYLSGGQQ
jgi:hypothetical protein